MLRIVLMVCFSAVLTREDLATQDAWQKAHTLNNRYEGLIDVPVGSHPLEILSFTSYFRPFSGQDEK